MVDVARVKRVSDIREAVTEVDCGNAVPIQSPLCVGIALERTLKRKRLEAVDRVGILFPTAKVDRDAGAANEAGPQQRDPQSCQRANSGSLIITVTHVFQNHVERDCEVGRPNHSLPGQPQIYIRSSNAMLTEHDPATGHFKPYQGSF